MPEVDEHLRKVKGALSPLRLALKGLDVEEIALTVKEGSPWVQATVNVHLSVQRRYAVWAETGDVYELGSDGAVGDDPVVRSQQA